MDNKNPASFIQHPKVSIYSPSLNTGRFLRSTIESITNQTFTDYEYIVIDGGSTDDTIDILKEYPQVRWISEEEEGDNGILDAIWKGFYMSRGQYFTCLAISDGFLDPDWLKKCVEVLDSDIEVSAVWGIHQEMTEDGHYGAVPWPQYLKKEPPPQKSDFLPFWLACRHDIEAAAIFRRDVFERCYPRNEPQERYRYFPHCGLNYNLNTMGYQIWFLPYLSFYARTHANQRQGKFYDMLDAVTKQYDRDIDTFRKNLFSRRQGFSFKDGNSNITKALSPQDISSLKKEYRRYLIKYKLRKYCEKLIEHL